MAHENLTDMWSSKTSSGEAPITEQQLISKSLQHDVQTTIRFRLMQHNLRCCVQPSDFNLKNTMDLSQKTIF